eukprot:gene18407-24109_t
MRSFFTRSAPKAPPTGPKNPPPVQPRTTIMSQLDDFESDGGGEFRSEEDEDEPPPDDADEFSEDPPEDDDDEGDFEDAEEYEEDEEDIEEDDEDDPPPDDDDEDVDPPDDEEEDELEDPDEEEEFEEDDEIDEDEDDEEEEDDVDDDPPSPPPLKRENSSRLPPPPPVIRDIPPPQPPIKQNNPPPPGPPPRNDDNRISMKAPPPPQIKPPVFDNRESNNIAPPIRPPPAIKPPVLPPRTKTQLGQEDKRQSTSLSTLFNDESFRNSLSLSKSLVIPLTEADSNRRFSSRMSFINNTISSSAPSPNTITVNTPVVNNDTKESDKKEKDGYLEVQGKFEGDPFEILYIKPTKTNMFVRVITGEEASFDLTKNSYVYEDIDDPKCFVLDYAGNMIVFKVKTRDELTAILAAMPRKVFEAPADNDPPPPPIDSSLTATVKSNKPFNYSDEENDSSKANVKHIKENDLSDLWSYFQSGVSLFDIIYHFNGPVTIGTDSKKVTIDPLRITSNPKSISEFRANSNYVFSLLKALSIEVLWDADDWITYPDTEFILLQLQLIYDKFSTSQCSLPPANGTVAGITSGPNGEPRVVGLIYADTLLSNRVSVERMAKGVLVGIGEDALPLLPIDNSHLVKSRYYAPTLPQGLMSFMASSVKVIHSSIQLREKVNDKNKEWNSSHAVDRVSRDRHHKDEGLLNILRSVSKPITSTIPAADISMDPTKDTIHSSARKTRKSVIDRSIGTTRRASSIPQVTISTLENVKSLDDLNKLLEKQYDDLIQTLDNDLKDSIDEMNKQEDDLTHRYNELEEISERVTQKDYERILNQLEIEKLQLESERIRVKEHYELRKISISKQHNETASRMRAKFEENSKPITVVNTTPFSKTKAITKKAEVNLSNVEKGWIKTFTKKNTHNIHLNRMQNQSINNVKATWTPDKYKGKEKQQPTNKSFISSDSNKNIFTTDELTINDKTDNSSLNSYNLFKIYLHNVTKKWIDNQKPVSTKLDTSLESSNVNKSKSNLISLPNKVPNDWGILPNKVVNDDSNDAFDAIGTAIRKEENDRLQYEDERRRTYLAQLYTEANGIPPSNLIYVGRKASGILSGRLFVSRPSSRYGHISSNMIVGQSPDHSDAPSLTE